MWIHNTDTAKVVIYISVKWTSCQEIKFRLGQTPFSPCKAIFSWSMGNFDLVQTGDNKFLLVF
jgi:hypothetical protein